MTRVLLALCLLTIAFPTTSSAQSGSGINWPTATPYSITGTLTIQNVGVDSNQLDSGNVGFVFLNVTPSGAQPCGYGGLYIPFYNLDSSFALVYSNGLNPAAKSMYNQILGLWLTGVPLKRVDFWQKTTYPYMCYIKLIQS